MTTVVTPEQYLSKPHALVESGKLIAALAKRVYITGSKTALKVAGAALSRSLEDAGVEYTIREYNGYPTDEIAADLAEQAKQTGAQALVAVGGGRIHDAVKTAGAVGGFPVVSVPTIAATCACWAAVSVMYDAEGKFAGLIHHKKSPALVIADTNILAYAPVRYIRSGIGDTLAKWYEIAPNLRNSRGFYLRLALKSGELAREILEGGGLRVVADLEQGIYNPEAVIEIIDAIILLAGLCGSFQRLEAPQGGIAHALYNNFSIIPELRGKLHGEKVAFGLIVQGILENQSLQELESRIAVFNALKLPLTLEELGLTGDVDAKLIKVALLVKQHVPHYNGLYKPYAAEDLVAAIKEASRLTREYRKRQYEPVAKPA